MDDLGFTPDDPSADLGFQPDPYAGNEFTSALHGAEREGMGLGNIVDKILPSSWQIPGTSKQDLQNFDQQHAAEFANNKVGKFVGQALPLALAQFIPGLDVGADAGVGAQLASVAGNAALGGLGSAATADPEHQGSAALEGMALGGGLAGAGAALRSGLTPAAQRLVDLGKSNGVDMQVPLAAGGTGVLSRTLRALQPYNDTPLYSRQMEALGNDVRTTLGRNASPPGAIPVTADTPLKVAQGLKPQFDAAYQRVLSRWQQPTGFDPDSFRSSVMDEIIARAPNVSTDVANKVADQSQSILKSHAPPVGQSGMTGEGLQNAWNAMGKGVSGSQGEEKAAWLAARSALDNVRRAGLSSDDQAALDAINAKYGESLPFAAAARATKAKNGNFSADQIGSRAREGTDALQAAQDWNVLKSTGREIGGKKVGWAGKALSVPATVANFTLGTMPVQRAILSGVPSRVLTRALPLTVGASDALGQ